MIRFRARLLTLVLAAGAALVAVQPVAASSPISVAGTFFFVAASVPSGFRMADGNVFVTLAVPAGVVTGDITGNFTEQLHIVTHPDGSQNVQGNATCTCALGGRTGTLVFDNIAGTTNTSGVSEAHFVLSGSGGLADLHGQGTAIVSTTPQGPFGVYTRSEEHTSELQSQSNLVCRLLLEKKKHQSTCRNACRYYLLVHTPLIPHQHSGRQVVVAEREASPAHDHQRTELHGNITAFSRSSH